MAEAGQDPPPKSNDKKKPQKHDRLIRARLEEVQANAQEQQEQAVHSDAMRVLFGSDASSEAPAHPSEPKIKDVPYKDWANIDGVARKKPTQDMFAMRLRELDKKQVLDELGMNHVQLMQMTPMELEQHIKRLHTAIDPKMLSFFIQPVTLDEHGNAGIDETRFRKAEQHVIGKIMRSSPQQLRPAADQYASARRIHAREQADYDAAIRELFDSRASAPPRASLSRFMAESEANAIELTADSKAASEAALRAMPSEEALGYPIVKLVAISVTHGAAVGEMDCELPYATHDFRKVFFHAPDKESVYFDDPNFAKLFSSWKKPFTPDRTTMDLLLGTGRPKCRYDDPNVYLPPIVFTLEPSSDDNWLIGHENVRMRNIIGVYLYVIRENPQNKKKFIQKIMVADYKQLDQTVYLTYSIIFDRIHKFIKANDEFRNFMRKARNPLTVGFFCCRGHFRYNPFNMASIQMPHTCLPPLPTILFVDNSVDAHNIPYPRLFLHTMPPTYTIDVLHSIMGGQPLLRRGMRNVTWQSCLYNLFVFFNIISRESADALASVASSQQIRQLSTDAILVSGESTQEAIRILNGLIPANIQRVFLVQRLPIPLGIYKIISVLNHLTFRNTYVVFAKVYPKEYVPTAPNIPSQMGHWIAIARFFGDLRMYYVDVQTSQYTLIPPFTPSNAAFIYSELLILFAPYVVMDLLYVSTPVGPYFHGPDVLNLQWPQPPPPPPPSSGGGMRRQRHVVSKKRKLESKTKTRTKKIA
jgi:hypothetical protein